MKGLDGLIGTTIGRYRVERLLGYGGTGAVYQAVDAPLARTVALKVLLPSLLAGPPRLAFLDRFQDEARLVATLHHPNILPVYDFGIDAGIAYLVMCFAADGSLDTHLNPAKGGGPLPLQQAVHYLVQAAAALDYGHRQGIVHRDVKPHNLLLDGPRLLLSDFGLARMTSDADERNPAAAPTVSFGGATVRGTPCYLAPEQGAREVVDWRADIYALGITLYEMLTGHVPFPATSGGAWAVVLQHLLEPPPPLVGQRAEVTSAMEAVVLKALAKDPHERYRSAGELAAAFRQATAIRRIGALPATSLPAPRVTPQPQRAPAELRPAQPVVPQPQPTGSQSRTAAGRLCPVCGTLNRPAAHLCLRDGTPLPPLRAADGQAASAGQRRAARQASEGASGGRTLRHAQRRCSQCKLPVEARAPSCPECGSHALVTVSGPALADLIARQQPRQAQCAPPGEDPMVRCAFCHRRIEAAEAWHSRYDGQPVCWTCKQAENANK